MGGILLRSSSSLLRCSLISQPPLWRFLLSFARVLALVPLGVPFRFSLASLGYGFPFPAWHEEAPNSCIGGAGATAPHAFSSHTAQRLVSACPHRCRFGALIAAPQALFMVVHVHEYLRGVSVVQGLPPWIMPARPIAVSPAGPQAAALPVADGYAWGNVDVRSSVYASLQSFAPVREYLRGVRTVPAAATPSVLARLRAPLAPCPPVACLLAVASDSQLASSCVHSTAAASYQPVACNPPPWAALCCLPLSGARPSVLRPLGLAVTGGRVLDWQPWRDRKGRTARHSRSTRPPSRCWCGLWTLLLQCLALPCKIVPDTPACLSNCLGLCCWAPYGFRC